MPVLNRRGQTGSLQALGQGIGRVHAVRAGGIPGIAHKDLAAQIGAGGQHHALCGVLAVELGNDALHPAVFHLKAHHLGLMDGKGPG